MKKFVVMLLLCVLMSSVSVFALGITGGLVFDKEGKGIQGGSSPYDRSTVYGLFSSNGAGSSITGNVVGAKYYGQTREKNYVEQKGVLGVYRKSGDKRLTTEEIEKREARGVKSRSEISKSRKETKLIKRMY